MAKQILRIDRASVFGGYPLRNSCARGVGKVCVGRRREQRERADALEAPRDPDHRVGSPGPRQLRGHVPEGPAPACCTQSSQEEAIGIYFFTFFVGPSDCVPFWNGVFPWQLLVWEGVFPNEFRIVL